MIQALVCKADSDSDSLDKTLVSASAGALIALIWHIVDLLQAILTSLARTVPGHSGASVRAGVVWLLSRWPPLRLPTTDLPTGRGGAVASDPQFVSSDFYFC
ncbi:hypothetical protein MHYP_G00025590 [Metynnis hypsauchen]